MIRAIAVCLLGLTLTACSPVGGGRRVDGLRIENDTARTLSVSVDHGLLDPSSGDFRPLGMLLEGDKISRSSSVRVDLAPYENLRSTVDASRAVLRVRAMDSNYRSTLTTAYLVPVSSVAPAGSSSYSAPGSAYSTVPVAPVQYHGLTGRVRWEGYPNHLWLVVESGFAQVEPRYDGASTRPPWGTRYHSSGFR